MRERERGGGGVKTKQGMSKYPVTLLLLIFDLAYDALNLESMKIFFFKYVNII